jgi:hypothetical protein
MECYECEAEISDKALSCPHCGAPSKNHLEKAILDKQKSEREKKAKVRTKATEDWIQSQKEKKRLETLIAIFCILSLVFPIFAFFSITWSINVYRREMDQGGNLFTSIGFFIAGLFIWVSAIG